MANETCFRGSDIVPHEFYCHEAVSRSSRVTESELCSSLDGENVSMSESHGIPEVPGRHKIATCRDIGFFTTSSSAQEAMSSSRSDSHISEVAGSAEGDDAVAGMRGKSSSNLSPLKNAPRISNLFCSGTEDNTCKDPLIPLEGKESGISLNENLLLSVDLTTADLGTICDVNDNSCYPQLVLRNMITEGKVDRSDPGRPNHVTEVASAVSDEKDIGPEGQNEASAKMAGMAIEHDTCHSKDLVNVHFDERTSKFRIVQLKCSDQDIFKDAEDTNRKTFADKTIIIRDETVVNGVLHDASETVSQNRDDEPCTVTKNVCDNVDDIETYFEQNTSGDSSRQSLVQGEMMAGQADELAIPKDEADITENTASLQERDDFSLTKRSLVIVEALLRAGAGSPITAAVRAVLCFTAAFILLYAPSTLMSILTLYLQLLVCAIFVDIFLN